MKTRKRENGKTGKRENSRNGFDDFDTSFGLLNPAPPSLISIRSFAKPKAGVVVFRATQSKPQPQPQHATRNTQHATHFIFHVSRITHHVSRFTTLAFRFSGFLALRFPSERANTIQ